MIEKIEQLEADAKLLAEAIKEAKKTTSKGGAKVLGEEWKIIFVAALKLAADITRLIKEFT